MSRDQGMAGERWVSMGGVAGLCAALCVGAGEFLLHFDSAGRFGEGYAFMRGISAGRSTAGHFLGVLGAPVYLIGFWHLMKMLEPASRTWARVAFFVQSYGIVLGAVWIGSRASISALSNAEAAIGGASSLELIGLYVTRYESLLQGTRLSVLIFSALFVGLVVSGRSRYPRWMAALNPLLLILASFAVWALFPAVGVYLMPIALNVAFGVLFIASTAISLQKKESK